MAHRRGKNWVATGYDPITKQKRHLGTRPSRKEAVQLEANWKLRARPTGQETCDHFAERWPTDYPRPRASTNSHNAERTKTFLKDFKGVKLNDVDRPTARAWALRHKHSLPAVRAMFGDALRDGLVEMNPFANLRLPGSKGRKEIIALTEQELHELAALALHPDMELGEYGPVYQAMILFAGYVGLRPGELFALQHTDIHGQLVTIERSYSSKTRETGPTKTGRPRTVVIPPIAHEALSEVPQSPSGLLFTSPTDRQWTQPLHHVYWSRLRRLAHRPGLDFYELRHAAATMALERGVTPWDVAQQLGHTDGGQLIMGLYGHPSEAGARARLLNAWDDEDGPTPIRQTSKSL